MEERRKFVRLNTNVAVKLEKINEEPENIQDNVVSKNVSAGGICLIMYEKNIDVGEMVKLEIQLPQENPVIVKGRIVWINEFEIVGQIGKKRYDVGIEFTDISEKDSEKIKKFIFTFFRREWF